MDKYDKVANPDGVAANEAVQVPVKDLKAGKYTFKYRIIKTLLLIAAWISFGVNAEMIGSTLEDLKIYLDVDYQSISFSLVNRSIGYLMVISFCGILFDKYPDYSDMFMAFSCLFLAIPNILIPITPSYWLSVGLFLIQGVSTAFYDLGGNHIILSLWKGISSSPINAMHAGYGIGALMAVQISKPFIKFDPLDKYRNDEYLSKNLNSTLIPNSNLNDTELNDNKITTDKINLIIPYTIAGLIAILLGILFMVAQVIEKKNTKNFNNNKSAMKLALLGLDENKNKMEGNEKNNFVLKLLFGDVVYKGRDLFYMISQIALVTLILFCLQGYLTVLSKFMLTYLTKGPGKFTIDEYCQLQTLFWLLFVVSRFIAAFLAYKMNSIVFVFIILIVNMFTILSFTIPYFCQFKIFFWIAICLLGLASGPAHPSTMMAAKSFLGDYNSFVISIFSLGLGLSSIVFQQLSGKLLDSLKPMDYFLGFNNFDPAYIIVHVCFIPCFFSVILFLIMFILYKKYFHLINKDSA